MNRVNFVNLPITPRPPRWNHGVFRHRTALSQKIMFPPCSNRTNRIRTLYGWPSRSAPT